MKIARVTLSYDRESGISRGVAEVVGRLVRDGHEVHVFTRGWHETEVAGVEFHRIPQFSERWSLSRYFFFVASGMMLRMQDFDIVHLHHPSLYSCDVISCHGLARAGLNAAIDSDESYVNDGDLKRLRHYRHLLPMLEYNFKAGKRKKIISLSEVMKQELMNLVGVPEDDIIVIPNGVNLDEFHPSNREFYRDKVRKEYGIKENEFLFLFVGNYFRRKGLQFLIDALNEIKEKPVRVFVVGQDDSCMADFVKKVQDMGLGGNVSFVGHTPRISQFYAAADAFVLPTVYEGFSLAILEAMACGLPVITSNVSGARDLIKDGVDGVLLRKPGDRGELIIKMLKIAEDHRFRDSLGKEASKRAQLYSWDKVVRKTVDLYEEILGNRKN